MMRWKNFGEMLRDGRHKAYFKRQEDSEDYNCIEIVRVVKHCRPFSNKLLENRSYLYHHHTMSITRFLI